MKKILLASIILLTMISGATFATSNKDKCEKKGNASGTWDKSTKTCTCPKGQTLSNNKCVCRDKQTFTNGTCE